MLRQAVKGDTAAIRALSVEVFAQFGDYGTFLPRYLDDPWVRTIVAVDQDDGGAVLQGFIMVGLTASRRRDGVLVADILAIAVAPAHQGRGLGAALLGRGLVLAATLAARYGVDEVELSVADTNAGALRFFQRHGFVVVDDREGRYPEGQVAIRMARPLRPAAAPPRATAS